MWREVYGRGIATVDIEPIGDTPFHAEVTFSQLPGVSIAAGSRSPAHYRASKELAKRTKDLMVISITVPLMIALTLFVKYTKLGKAMRATAQNPTVFAVIWSPSNWTSFPWNKLGYDVSDVQAFIGDLISGEYDLEGTVDQFSDWRDFFIGSDQTTDTLAHLNRRHK